MLTQNATPLAEPALALTYHQQLLAALRELAAQPKCRALVDRVLALAQSLYRDRYVDLLPLMAAQALAVASDEALSGVVAEVLTVWQGVRVEPVGA